MSTNRKDSRGRVLEKNEVQRKNGTYAFIYKDTLGSKRFLYAPDLVTLREKEKKLQIAQWQGVDLERGNELTINDVFDRYMSTKLRLKSTTAASYQDMYDRYVRDGFGRRCIKDIKNSDVRAFYASMLSDLEVSIRSVEFVHMLLHPTFGLAVDDGILQKNPTDKLLKMIREVDERDNNKRHPLTQEQQRNFLEFIKEHPVWRRYHSIFVVLLGTGLRAGELTGLRWQDIDFDKRSININHALVSVKPIKGVTKAHLEISTPKTKSGIRNVPIMDPVMEGFQEEYRLCMAKGFSDYEVDGYSGFVFTNGNGKPYTAVRLDKALRDIVNAYNKREEAIAEREGVDPQYLPKFSCHVLRHTFCTRLCEQDVNVKVIQSVMGHANISITMDIYTKVSEEKKLAEIDKLAKDWNIF